MDIQLSISKRKKNNSIGKEQNKPHVLYFSTTETFGEHKRLASLKLLADPTSYLTPELS